MRIEKFEQLNSWTKAQEMSICIYQNFNQIRDFSFRDQICRASVSVSNNIAEGFDRGTNKEFIRFLFIARGSNSEVKSMLYLAKGLNYIENTNFEKAMFLCEDAGRLINGFISYLYKKENQLSNEPTGQLTNE